MVKKATDFDFKWVGGLSELKDKFSSVELEKKALEWTY